jgi:hypothetical protein
MIRHGHWSCGARRRVLFVLGGLLVVCLNASPALGDVTFTYTTHAALQAVLHGEDDVWGNTAWPGGGLAPYPIQMTGVVINNPWDILNYDNSVDQPQWQVFVQATAGGDYGGTAMYMRKKIPWAPSQNYTDAEWSTEMARVNHPGGVSEPLQRGDRINIYARAPGAFYNGKYNVNETHKKDPLLDFDIEILERGIELAPLAAQIALSDLTVGGDDGFIFDGTRATGCEHYQGSLVHLDNLLLDDPGNWGLNKTVTVRQDDLTFKMLLGLDPDLALVDASLLATNPFSVIAILDQEDSSAPYTGGYRLWLTNASDLSAVPEPGTMVLTLLGGLLIYPLARRMGRSRTR